MRIPFRTLRVVLLALPWIGSAHALFAQGLPNASFNASALYDTCPLESPCLLQQAVHSLNGSPSATVSASPCSLPMCDGTQAMVNQGAFGSIVGQVTTGGRQPYGVGGSLAANSQAEFFYQVVGPSPAVLVPMLFSGNLYVDVSGDDTTAQAEIVGLPQTFEMCITEQGTTVSDCGGTRGLLNGTTLSINNYAYDVSSNTFQFLDLYAAANAGYGPLLGEAAQYFDASYDPMLTIDPSWLTDHPGYSLELSSNIILGSPGSSVPEPATLALFGLGLAGVGLSRPRRAR